MTNTDPRRALTDGERLRLQVMFDALWTVVVSGDDVTLSEQLQFLHSQLGKHRMVPEGELVTDEDLNREMHVCRFIPEAALARQTTSRKQMSGPPHLHAHSSAANSRHSAIAACSASCSTSLSQVRANTAPARVKHSQPRPSSSSSSNSQRGSPCIGSIATSACLSRSSVPAPTTNTGSRAGRPGTVAEDGGPLPPALPRTPRTGPVDVARRNRPNA